MRFNNNPVNPRPFGFIIIFSIQRLRGGDFFSANDFVFSIKL